MTTPALPVCYSCQRFRPWVGPCCDAFPAGIPDQVLEDGDIHAKEIKGDKGLRFIEGPQKKPTGKALDDQFDEFDAAQE